MYNERLTEDAVVLCGASAYEEKYYLNPTFSGLPEDVRSELRVICVLFTQEVGGTFLMQFDEEGNLGFETQAKDGDYNYDEVGAALLIREIRSNRSELLASLELYYRVVILGIPLEEA